MGDRKISLEQHEIDDMIFIFRRTIPLTFDKYSLKIKVLFISNTLFNKYPRTMSTWL